MAQPTPPLYALDPALPVLLRPDGAVQVGWSPRRAVLIHPPRGLTPAGLATLLRTMHSPVPMSELQRQADRQGGVAAGELGDLVAVGVATRGRRPRPARSASIRVHGRGPLSELLIEALRCSGARVKQSSQPHAAVTSAEADLVVLYDNQVADPRMLRDLHSHGVAHLAVRVRDGIGLVGPLVIPVSPAAWVVTRGNYLQGRACTCMGCIREMTGQNRSNSDGIWLKSTHILWGTISKQDKPCRQT